MRSKQQGPEMQVRSKGHPGNKNVLLARMSGPCQKYDSMAFTPRELVNTMPSIMFVCTGNIFRSMTAEYALKARLAHDHRSE